MKEIIIYQEKIEPLIIEDDDNKDLEEYTQELSKLFEATNVVILSCTSGNYVIRPHKIVSLKVLETKKEKEVDVITDGE